MYVRSRDQYNDFCVTNQLRLHSKKSVEYWVVKLANVGKSHGSILSSVSASKLFCTKEGKKLNFATARLKFILCGIKNSGPIQLVSYDQCPRFMVTSPEFKPINKEHSCRKMVFN